MDDFLNQPFEFKQNPFQITQFNRSGAIAIQMVKYFARRHKPPITQCQILQPFFGHLIQLAIFAKLFAKVCIYNTDSILSFQSIQVVF